MRRGRPSCRGYETAWTLSLTQLGIFGDGQRTLVDDETGRIVYIPGFAGAPAAAAWFSALRDGVAWQNERRRMYDRDVDVPRLVARYRLDDPGLPAAIAEASERASQVAGTRFNSAGLNYYRDGRDSVAPHNDHLYEIVPGHPIALISLGATRLMTIRSKAANVILSPSTSLRTGSVEGRRRILDIDLENGSLLLMSYETQMHYDHGVPKTKTPVEARISLALRVRPSPEPVEGSG
ncbi:MAG: alpha-ketoglutarate-dependent dioxygenase AlkB [Candidatus Cybelea sp.]